MSQETLSEDWEERMYLMKNFKNEGDDVSRGILGEGKMEFHVWELQLIS